MKYHYTEVTGSIAKAVFTRAGNVRKQFRANFKLRYGKPYLRTSRKEPYLHHEGEVPTLLDLKKTQRTGDDFLFFLNEKKVRCTIGIPFKLDGKNAVVPEWN